jgi:hypothetical protein
MERRKATTRRCSDLEPVRAFHRRLGCSIHCAILEHSADTMLQIGAFGQGAGAPANIASLSRTLSESPGTLVICATLFTNVIRARPRRRFRSHNHACFGWRPRSVRLATGRRRSRHHIRTSVESRVHSATPSGGLTPQSRRRGPPASSERRTICAWVTASCDHRGSRSTPYGPVAVGADRPELHAHARAGRIAMTNAANRVSRLIAVALSRPPQV